MTLKDFRTNALPFLVSLGLSIAAIVLMPTATSAACYYGWCDAPPPWQCEGPCDVVESEQSRWYENECEYFGNGYCVRYICWYYDEVGGQCDWLCWNEDWHDCDGF